MASECGTQEKLISAAENFLNIQTTNHQNAQQIEQILTDVIDKAIEYRNRSKETTKENQMLKNTIKKFYQKIMILRVELSKCKLDAENKDKLLQQHKIDDQWKYNRLYCKLLNLIQQEDNHENENENESSNCSNSNDITMCDCPYCTNRLNGVQTE